MEDKNYTDYIDAFTPFLIQYFKNNQELRDKAEIRDGISSEFKFILPLHVLSALLDRLLAKRYISIDKGKYKITQKGLEYPSQFEDPVAISKNIQLLIADLTKYLENRLERSMSKEETLKLIRAFIYINFDKSITPEDLETNFGLSYHKNIKKFNYISTYVESIEKRKPKIYKIFKDLVKGYIIYLSIGSFPERHQRFKGITIYLDTNILFDILELHTPEFILPEKELFKLLKSNKLDVAVLDFTIEETKNYLNNCISNKRKQTSEIEDLARKKLKIDSICENFDTSFLKSEKIDFINRLEDRIKSLDIRIEKTGINIGNYVPLDGSIGDEIKLYKPKIQPTISRNHDIAAIEFIKSSKDLKIYNELKIHEQYF